MVNVLDTKEIGEEVELIGVNVFNGFEITLEEFKDVLTEDIVGKDIIVEMQLGGTVLTGQTYESIDVSFNKRSIILDEEDNDEKIFTNIPIHQIDTILEGDGFIMEDNWLVKLKNGLNYYISIA